MNRLLSVDAWKNELKEAALGGEHFAIDDDLALFKDFLPVIKGMDETARTIDFTISTASVDRDGDIIAAKGWELKNYRKNPVVLWAHRSFDPPIGRGSKVKREGDELSAIAQFMDADLNPFADMIFRMYLGKYLNAVSVGFRALVVERAEEDEERGPWALNFMKQELLEFSPVAIPANPEALIRVQSDGISLEPMLLWLSETLDDPAAAKTGLLSRDTYERAWTIIGKGATYSLPEAPTEPDVKAVALPIPADGMELMLIHADGTSEKIIVPKSMEAIVQADVAAEIAKRIDDEFRTDAGPGGSAEVVAIVVRDFAENAAEDTATWLTREAYDARIAKLAHAIIVPTDEFVKHDDGELVPVWRVKSEDMEAEDLDLELPVLEDEFLDEFGNASTVDPEPEEEEDLLAGV